MGQVRALAEAPQPRIALVDAGGEPVDTYRLPEGPPRHPLAHVIVGKGDYFVWSERDSKREKRPVYVKRDAWRLDTTEPAELPPMAAAETLAAGAADDLADVLSVRLSYVGALLEAIASAALTDATETDLRHLACDIARKCRQRAAENGAAVSQDVLTKLDQLDAVLTTLAISADSPLDDRQESALHDLALDLVRDCGRAAECRPTA